MAVGNLLGAVCIWDGETPRTFTGFAMEVISGGQFVYVSGATGTAQVGSQAASYQDGDLDVCLKDKFDLCNGIALGNAGSDELVTVATRGTYIFKAGGNISGGMLVCSDEDCVNPLASSAVGSEIYGVVGRALTNAGSEGYCLVSLNVL